MNTSQAAKIKAMYDLTGCQNKARQAFAIAGNDELAKECNWIGHLVTRQPISLLEGNYDNNSTQLYSCKDITLYSSGKVKASYEGDLGVGEKEFTTVKGALDSLNIELDNHILETVSVCAIFGYNVLMV